MPSSQVLLQQIIVEPIGYNYIDMVCSICNEYKTSEEYELLYWDYNGEKSQAEYYKFSTDITLVAKWIKSKTN